MPTPVDPEVLRMMEEAIDLRLRYYLSAQGVAITAFPEDATKFPRATPKGQILLGYRNSTFKASSESPLTMNWFANFELLINFQDLRSHTGAYPLLDWARYALLGFRPVVGPVKGMRPTTEKIEGMSDDGTWEYSQQWQVPLVLIEGQNPYTRLPIPVPSDPISQILDPPPFVVTRISVGVWRNRVGETPNSDEALLDREWDEIE